MSGPNELLESFNRFLPLYNGVEKNRVEKLKEQLDDSTNAEKILQKFAVEVTRYWKMVEEIRNFTDDYNFFPLLAIKCRDFKEVLATKADFFARELLRVVREPLASIQIATVKRFFHITSC